MGLLQKIRRHGAVASGNFASMFQHVEIPPLPATTAHLVEEYGQPEPDVRRLATLITASPDLAARVLRTVNSSRYALRNPVSSVQHAISLLGLKQVRAIALPHAMMEGMPLPGGEDFDAEAFWTDNLVRALLARRLAERDAGCDPDTAFTAGLLANVALPVLLVAWSEYYRPVTERWREESARLSEIERADFGWDHAQAGAWILQSWGFPEELVCLVAAHNLDAAELAELELEDTLAPAVAVAALLPSVLRPDPRRRERLLDLAASALQLPPEALAEAARAAAEELDEMRAVFGLGDREGARALHELMELVSGEAVGERT